MVEGSAPDAYGVKPCRVHRGPGALLGLNMESEANSFHKRCSSLPLRGGTWIDTPDLKIAALTCASGQSFTPDAQLIV